MVQISTQRTTPNVKAEEVGRNLVVTSPAGRFEIRPLPAVDGGKLMATFVNTQFGGHAPDEDTQVDMFVKALGSELYEELTTTLRLPEVTPIAQCALYWQTVGIDAVQAFLAEGPIEALKMLLAQMGLSLSNQSPNTGSGSQTLAPAVTANTATPSGGGTSFNKG